MAPTTGVSLVAAFLRYNHPHHHDHFYTTSIAEIGHANNGQVGNHGYQSEGHVGYIFTAPVPSAVPIYRYLNESTHDHFYTTNIAEIGHANQGQVGAHGFKSEGIAGYIYSEAFAGTAPLYRYHNATTHDHFYTTDWNEIGASQPGQVGKHGYAYEGILGYVLVQPAEAVPLYRYFRSDVNDHFYTTSITEIGHATPGQAGNHGYVCEGTAGRVWNQFVPGTVPLYRYFHPQHTDHFYTTNISEIGHANQGQVGNHGYLSEGIAGYVYPQATSYTTPLYRYYRDAVKDHFYTTNANEIGVTQSGAAGHHGFVSEGIAAHVLL